MGQTVAEKAAWELSKEVGVELVVINPGFVWGPVVSGRGDATSITLLKVKTNQAWLQRFGLPGFAGWATKLTNIA